MKLHPRVACSGVYVLACVLLVSCGTSRSCAKTRGDDDAGLYPALRGGKWGSVNRRGELVIPHQFDVPLRFQEGMAAVSLGGVWGFVDTAGKIAINPQFESAGDFSEGLAVVALGRKFGYVDRKGGIAINPQFDAAAEFHEGMARVALGGKWGFIDREGKIAINPQFDEARDFSEKRAAVLIGDRTGFIAPDGKVVINPQFEGAGDFSEGLCQVRLGGRIGYIDAAGKYVITPQFDVAGPFAEGLAPARLGERYGFVDREGKFAVNPQFDAARGFADGRAAVRVGPVWGFIDKQGKLVINPAFVDAGDFAGGVARAQIESGAANIGYVDLAGKWIWDPRQPRLAVRVQTADGSAGSGEPGSLSLDSVQVGTTRSLVLSLRNTGAKDLALTGAAEVSGPHAGQFTCSRVSVSLLPPGSATTLTLQFTPDSEGEKHALLSVRSNDPERPTLSLPLSGWGEPLAPVAMEQPGAGAEPSSSAVAATDAEPLLSLSFDGEIRDASRFRRAVQSAGARLVADRRGREDAALGLSGGYLQVPGSDFAFSAEGAFSIALWVKPESRGASYRALVVKGGPFWDYGVYLQPDNTVMMGHHGHHEAVSRPIDAGWHSVVGSYDNREWAVWVDGQLQARVRGTAITASSGNLCIGRKGDAAMDFFAGDVDDVAVFARKLSDDEIRRLAQR